MKKSAVILSGGKNSRMNYNTKAFLKLENKRFIDIELEALAIFDEIIISCNDEELYKEFKYKLVKDEVQDIGPLGGIYSCLKNSEFEVVLFVGSDMPFLTKEFMEKLYKEDFEEDALIVRIDGNIEPLCSLYKKSSLNVIENMIRNKNYKLKNYIDRLNVKYLDLKNNIEIKNINTINEFRELEKGYGED